MTPQNFCFEDMLVRVEIREGAPWFVASDVCNALGIANSRDAVSKLDEDEKGVGLTDTRGGAQNHTIVSESGLYCLILRSRDAVTQGTIAHRFRKWVTGEVLPKIRRYGEFADHEGAALTTRDGAAFEISMESAAVVKLKMDLVAECRRLHGHTQAKELWNVVGLPFISGNFLPSASGEGEAYEVISTLKLARIGDEKLSDLIERGLSGDEFANDALRTVGISIDLDREGVVIANRSDKLSDIFEGTPWARHGWRRVLRRLEGTISIAGVRFSKTHYSRCVFVPGKHFDEN